MCDFFSTLNETVVCAQPVLTVGFPTTGGGGPNTVTLANGAVVDLNVLARIITDFCPGVVEAAVSPAMLCPTSEPALVQIVSV
jgi:hypothetical protein